MVSGSQPPQRDNVTALIAHFNEPFVRESVLSIAPFVAEVVVADSGSDDRYLDWLYQAARSAGNVRVHHLDLREKPYLGDIRNFLNEQARTEWSLLYDADNVAYETGERCLLTLYDQLRDGTPSDYYGLHCPFVSGDVDHHFAGKPFHPHRLVLYRRGMVDFLVDKCIDDVHINVSKVTEMPGHYWISTDLKPIERMTFRGVMDRFVKHNPDPAHLDTVWKWLYFNKNNRLPLNEQEVEKSKLASMKWQSNQVLQYDPFDYARWGSHPDRLYECEMLEEFVLTPVDGGFTRDRYPFFY